MKHSCRAHCPTCASFPPVGSRVSCQCTVLSPPPVFTLPLPFCGICASVFVLLPVSLPATASSITSHNPAGYFYMHWSHYLKVWPRFMRVHCSNSTYVRQRRRKTATGTSSVKIVSSGMQSALILSTQSFTSRDFSLSLPITVSLRLIQPLLFVVRSFIHIL